MQLTRIPAWTLCAGFGFLVCWLILRLVPALAALSLQFGLSLLGLSIAFIAYGVGYHMAINMGHWREVRKSERDDLAVLSGRMRFRRRKKLHPGLPGRMPESAAEEKDVFDALD